MAWNNRFCGAISDRAKEAIEANGGTVSPDGSGYKVTVEAELLKSSQGGAWGNFSFQQWALPDGKTLVWDSDDREWQRGRDIKADAV